MKRAIWAIYFHKLSTEDNPQHALCPLGEDSWCGYKRSIVTGEFYIHKHSLPESILLKVKKVFRDLTEKDLLKKCLHGRTQNPNESFNKCIWERIPKTVFVGIETLKFGVMDAVICFNDGYVSRIKVFEALGIKPGYNTERALLIIDNKQIFEAERIVNKVSLEARNKRSLKRKMDKQNLDEENEYQAGNINQIYNLEVSEELGIAQSVISGLWQRFQDDNVSRCYSTGRPRVTTPNEDRCLAVAAKRNRRNTA
ncbi:uncharacterized protein TNCV_756781 [Trichonephila clavipes]|nr:uncharacterized protein TNCV_756781 [Trichonephila clavipes]